MKIPERQAELNALVRKYLSDPEPEPKPNGNGHHTYTPSSRSDEEIIERLRSERNGKFDRLWAGDLSAHGGDHSRADDSFVFKVWSYTQDEEQVRRIHAMSGLHREKSARRADYLRRSINRAQEKVTWFYEWPEERVRVGGKKGEKETKEEQPEPPNPFQRSDLAGALERGVKPPEVLIAEVILAAKVHSIYSAGGTGKTFFAAYLSRKVLEKGGTVLYFDQENGLRIMAERAQNLGITPELAKNFYHYPFPTMPLDFAVIETFEQLLDELEPDLVVFDSWVNMLAMCGLDENSSVDIATWTEAYSQKARHRGVAVLILDHVPKEGGSARGSGRKLDYVDVMWELRNPQPFDRETVGRIDLHLRKDREGWLPRVLTYSVGGTENGFIFKRSLGTVEPKDEAGLSSKERATLEALEALGSMGAFDRKWKEEAESRGVKKSTYYQSKKRLLDLGLVENVMDKFFVKDLQKRGPNKSNGLHTDHADEEVQFSPGGLDPGLTGPPVDETCKHGERGSECPFCEDLFGGDE